MLRIGLINMKGGSGKSTAAAILAHFTAKTGKRVAVVDKDHAQATLSSIAKFGHLDGVELYRPGVLYDVVFYDGPGSLELPEAREILSVASKIVVPTTLSSLDLDSTASTAAHLFREFPDTPRALLFIAAGNPSEEEMDRIAKILRTPRFQGVLPEKKEFRRLLDPEFKWSKLPKPDRETIEGIVAELLAL